ncbi:MAG: pyridoxal phosphate-dependent aminotransferase family protein [candidate division Zixibacteria bacterium]|nr:pyridoxal phosphate-dependent aminotransferase family protein [candidate division Zixibacteria bacterium]
MRNSLESRQAQYITINGKKLIIFSSNDYLGLSHHPEVIKTFTEAAQNYGIGTGGAPLTSGTTIIHDKLADEIADFKHREKAVIFPSGYAANTALHQSLSDNDTIFFSDESNHPSIIDGIRLSGCPVNIYRHLDLTHLEALLKKSGKSRKIAASCSAFTVNGDILPLDKIARLKSKYHFHLILDEAHATGCIGKTGRGLEELYSLTGTADFIMGTFSKALGSQGGFLTFSEEAGKMLSGPLRAYKYSTSIAAPIAAASLSSLKILKREPELVARMRKNIQQIYINLKRSGFEINSSGSHIINVYFSSKEKTSLIIDELHRRGYFVVPVSPDKRWGIRITAMATHTDVEIDAFCRCLTEIRDDLQI